MTAALETPEHSGRVRGVGGFVTPKSFFNLPRQRTRISKAQLSEELENQKKEIAQLKAMISATNLLGSPNISDKSSCQEEIIKPKPEITKPKPEITKPKPEIVKTSDVEEDCMIFDHPPPSGIKVIFLIYYILYSLAYTELV